VYLVEVSELSDLAPQVLHDLLVVSEALGGVLATGLKDGGAEGKAFKVVLVQVSIVVNVCEKQRAALLSNPSGDEFSRGVA